MDEQRADRLEDLRQLEHFLPVGFAFLLPFMEFSTILLMALLAILYAVLISPRLVTTRAEERQRGFSTGKLTYALSVLGLILVFHDKLYLAAATWGILAAGDSVSNLLGRRYGRRPLPYNPQKTLVGLLGFGIAGGLAAWILLLWNLDGPQGSWPILLFLSFLVSFTCAFFESLPSPFDDNVVICWVGGTLFALLFDLENSFRVSTPWPEILLVNAVIAAISLRLKWLSRKGTLLAFIMGVVVYASLGRAAYTPLVLFLVLCSLATQAGAKEKEAQRISQLQEAPRGSINVISNGLVPLSLAVLGFWTTREYLFVAFLSGVVTATVDTVSTEIGQWLGKQPINPRSLKRCPPGTPGAMSLEGTLAGLGSGVLVALGGVLSNGLPPAILAVTIISGFIAATLESIGGSYLERNAPFSEEVLNLYNTFLGSFLGGILWLLL